MMVDSSHATSAQAFLGNTVWASSWSRAEIPGEIDAPNDVSTATGAGRLADLIALIVDGSGTHGSYIIEHKQINERAIALLRKWIDQYGDDRDPDLDEQIMELNKNRLSLRKQC
jgi:hypothetical protein